MFGITSGLRPFFNPRASPGPVLGSDVSYLRQLPQGLALGIARKALLHAQRASVQPSEGPEASTMASADVPDAALDQLVTNLRNMFCASCNGLSIKLIMLISS